MLSLRAGPGTPAGFGDRPTRVIRGRSEAEGKGIQSQRAVALDPLPEGFAVAGGDSPRIRAEVSILTRAGAYGSRRARETLAVPVSPRR